jgi:hypothetical protein
MTQHILPRRGYITSPQKRASGPSGYVCSAMLAKLNAFVLVGIEAVPVQVEVDASMGLPKTILVGLPEADSA